MKKNFDYQRYLASREWAKLRKAVHERAAGRCERCGDEPIAAVHHLTYERIGKETLDDLQAVCGPCHDFLSATSETDPQRVKLARLFARYMDFKWALERSGLAAAEGTPGVDGGLFVRRVKAAKPGGAGFIVETELSDFLARFSDPDAVRLFLQADEDYPG